MCQMQVNYECLLSIIRKNDCALWTIPNKCFSNFQVTFSKLKNKNTISY